jgi:hypothetical protein
MKTPLGLLLLLVTFTWSQDAFVLASGKEKSGTLIRIASDTVWLLAPNSSGSTDTISLPKSRISKIKLASGDTVNLGLALWSIAKADDWGREVALGQPSKPKPQVAILGFEGDKSSTPEQLDAITERFQSELHATNKFVILSRGQMDVILKEQGFQQSGVCNSSECQVKIGQLLGVDKLVAGKVVTFGGVYSFSINYLDVGTGVVENTISFEVEGTLVNVLKSGCKDAADMLVAKVFPPSVTTPAKPSVNEALTLNPTSVASLPQVSKSGSKSKWVAIAFDALAAGALGYGVYQNSQAVSGFSVYNGMAKGLPQTSYDSAWKTYTDAQTMRNIGYIAAGALLAVGLTVHIAF